jgi:hypothetical protein
MEPSEGSIRVPEIPVSRWPEQAERVRLGSFPVVVKGAIDVDTLSRTWTPENLRRLYGDRTVSVMVDLPDSECPYTRCAAGHQTTMRFAELLDRTLAAAPCYLNQAPLIDYPEAH